MEPLFYVQFKLQELKEEPRTVVCPVLYIEQHEYSDCGIVRMSTTEFLVVLPDNRFLWVPMKDCHFTSYQGVALPITEGESHGSKQSGPE